MLDTLCRGDERGVEHRFLTFLVQQVRAFLENAGHPRAMLSSRTDVYRFEHAFQTFDVSARFIQVHFKRRAKRLVAGALIIFGNAFTICFSAS